VLPAPSAALLDYDPPAAIDDRYWHFSDLPARALNVRCRRQLGHSPDSAEWPRLTHMRHRRAKIAVMHNATVTLQSRLAVTLGRRATTRRREFLALTGSAAVAWPLAARTQQPAQMRRIGILMNLTADDSVSQGRLTAFVQGLQELGWTVGRNLQIDYRWGAGNVESYRTFAAELVALTPDVLVTAGAPAVEALQRATRTVPIVFTSVGDPVGGGLVASLAQPGGITTGFTFSEYGFSGKWLELLKEIAPRVTRTAVLPVAVGIGQFAAIQAVAPSLQVELSPVDARDAGEIERAVTAFAHRPNGGLIVTSSASAAIHRELIITLAAQYRLPAVYPVRYYVTDGGLISYGPDLIDQHRRAAGYVDRILKGERPADLPVQAPTKYELVINHKTARVLGLTVPPSLLARADEVIE
jgi:putative tryptophan/tyrosine transport system substrate-binding protein